MEIMGLYMEDGITFMIYELLYQTSSTTILVVLEVWYNVHDILVSCLMYYWYLTWYLT